MKLLVDYRILLPSISFLKFFFYGKLFFRPTHTHIFTFNPNYIKMPLLAAYVVRISDRCVISQFVADPAADALRGELLTRCSSPDFRSSATQQLPSEDRKVGVHVLTDSTTGYVAITEEFTPRRSGQASVDEIARLFNKMYPEGVATLTPLQGKSFVKPLEGIVAKYPDVDTLDDKAKQVRKTVEEVKAIALDNVEKVLERGSKIDDIVNQTDQLQQNAEGFQRSSRDLRNHMWWNTMKTRLMIGGIVGVFLLLVYLIFCGGLSCSSSNTQN